jgi:hypothetical protein
VSQGKVNLKACIFTAKKIAVNKIAGEGKIILGGERYKVDPGFDYLPLRTSRIFLRSATGEKGF